MSVFKVAVSPHYRGNGWTDRGTGVQFKEQGAQLKTRTINPDKYEDLTGIKNSLRLNHLLLVDGTLPKDVSDTPNKVNPEELTGEELDKLLNNPTGVQKLQKENEQLKADIKEMKEKVKELKEEIHDVESKKVNNSEEQEEQEITKTSLSDENTKAELMKLADKEDIDYPKKANKGDLVDIVFKGLNSRK